ncbi:MAG: hypothetical protein VKK42_25605 [Lyngbya sp.]|nr:hypothetical protein [Lyngbya sp.]
MDSSTPFIQSGLASSFRQPATIAVLASLGIHALFALNIEKIALFPNSAQLPPSVELVELSPDQVSGIYPPPPPKFSLTPIAPPSSLSSILGGGPTIPEFPSSPPPPSPTFSSPQPQLYTIPVNPSVGSRGSGLPSYYPESSYPESSLESSPENYSFGTFPIPPNIPINTLPPPPSIPEGEDIPIDKNSKELERLRTFPEQLAQGEITFTDPPPDANIFNPQRISPDEPGSEPPRFPPPGSNDLAANNVDEQSSQPSSPDGRGSILQGLQENLNQEENPDVAANSAGNGPVFQQQPQQPPQGQVSNQELTMLEGGSLYASWVSGLQQSYPDIQPASPISISDVYPVEACEQQLNGQVLVGVVVGSGGEILAGPELLLDTGYPVLDNEAVQRVREFAAYEDSGGETPTAYQYAFEFNSENCGEPTSAEEVPPEVTPGNAQPAENNSTPGGTEESQDASEEPAVEPSEEALQTEPDQELEPDVEPSEEVFQTEPDQELEPDVEPSEEVFQTEPDQELELDVEPSEEVFQTEPDQELEPDVEPSEEIFQTEPDQELEPDVEPSEEIFQTEPDQELEPDVEPSEEVFQTEPDQELEPAVEPSEEVLQTEPPLEEVQPDAMPSEFDQPVDNITPTESEELME